VGCAAGGVGFAGAGVGCAAGGVGFAGAGGGCAAGVGGGGAGLRLTVSLSFSGGGVRGGASFFGSFASAEGDFGFVVTPGAGLGGAGVGFAATGGLGTGFASTASLTRLGVLGFLAGSFLATLLGLSSGTFAIAKAVRAAASSTKLLGLFAEIFALARRSIAWLLDTPSSLASS